MQTNYAGLQNRLAPPFKMQLLFPQFRIKDHRLGETPLELPFLPRRIGLFSSALCQRGVTFVLLLGVCAMKCAIKFIPFLLVLLALSGCASTGRVQGASPIKSRHLDLDLIFATTSSAPGNGEEEKQMLNDRIVSGLKDTHLFKAVSANKAELGSGSGIAIHATIKEIKRVSKNKRLWAGALAGRAQIWIQVTVSDLNSGNQIETFEADGESSGGSSQAGTTEEAVDRAAGVVVGEVLKINSLTAE
jgi:hypothetical protein